MINSNFAGPAAGPSKSALTFVVAMLLGLMSVLAFADGGRINLNAADAETLQIIPGIGAVRAGEIIRRRAELGEFTSYEQLLEVSGVGPKTLERIREHGALGDDAAEPAEGMTEPVQELPASPPAEAVSAADLPAAEVSG